MAETPGLPPLDSRFGAQKPFNKNIIRKVIKTVLDTGAAALAYGAVASLPPFSAGRPIPGWAAFVLVALGVDLSFGFPAQHYRAVAIQDALRLFLGAAVMAATVLGFGLAAGGPSFGLEPGAILGASLLTGFLWLAVRVGALAVHRALQARSRARGRAPAERTLIVGAGRPGMLLCEALRDHPDLHCKVLGFVDDAPEKQGLKVLGLPVLGTADQLPGLIRERKVSLVVLGMAGIPGKRLREMIRTVGEEGVRIKTVPGITELVGDRPWKPDLRDVAIEDLLQREPVRLDMGAIKAAVDGEVVLITGGGGSIGCEMARRMAELGPARLVLLGRGENSLWEARRQLACEFPRQAVETALCDIRDRSRLRQVFQHWRPKVVLHAAAHKHVPFLEANPEEAIQNNIFGTLNVLEAAVASGRCGIFVNISSDKAVNPVNVLGVSKAVGELLVGRMAMDHPEAKFVSVRFGNVLGSRGSVIPLFREQIRRGGPITITHPGMVRYFMTMSEAAQLVLQAGILGASGRVFALDMGEPVHILDLAEEMVRLSGLTPWEDVDFQFTGMRPGEKLVEDLFCDGRVRATEVHPKVFEAEVRAVDPGLLKASLVLLKDLQAREGVDRHADILRCFMSLVPDFRPSPNGLGRGLQPAADPASPPQGAPKAPESAVVAVPWPQPARQGQML